MVAKTDAPALLLLNGPAVLFNNSPPRYYTKTMTQMKQFIQQSTVDFGKSVTCHTPTLSEQSHILWIASRRIHRLSTITSQTADPVIACPTWGHLPFTLSAFSSLIKSPSDQSSSQLVNWTIAPPQFSVSWAYVSAILSQSILSTSSRQSYSTQRNKKKRRIRVGSQV